MSSSYGLPKEEAESYVLCDTIGSTGNHQWRPEGFRVVGDNERPLLLQSLWKPREGLARRFEIQRKSWVEERTSKDKDTITAGTMSTVETDRPLPNSVRLGIALKCIKKNWNKAVTIKLLKVYGSHDKKMWFVGILFFQWKSAKPHRPNCILMGLKLFF